jgi:hypothetical protein
MAAQGPFAPRAATRPGAAVDVRALTPGGSQAWHVDIQSHNLFVHKMRLAELQYTRGSKAAQMRLAENYLGPLLGLNLGDKL